MISTFVVFGIIDYNRFMDDKTPIFIVKKDGLENGGTIIYYGIGYQLINWKLLDEDSVEYYYAGKEVHFLHYIDPLEDEPSIKLEKLREKNLDPDWIQNN